MYSRRPTLRYQHAPARPIVKGTPFSGGGTYIEMRVARNRKEILGLASARPGKVRPLLREMVVRL
jgi:hypothetical protein